MIDPLIAQIAYDELSVFYEKFVEKLSSKSFLKGALKAVRSATLDALDEAGFDTSTAFVKAIASRMKIEVVQSGDKVDYILYHDFDNKTFSKTWQTKNGEGSSEIDSVDIAKFMDVGRPEYKISSNQDHEMLAIPPAGEEYRPDNKDNKVIRGFITIPKMTGARYMERAKKALDTYIDNKNIELVDEFENGLKSILSKVSA